MVGVEAPGAAGRETKGTRCTGGWRRSGWPCIRWSEGSPWQVPSARAPQASAWGVFIATLVHKPADSLTIVSLMLRAGVPRWQAHLVNLGFSLIPLGAILFYAGSRWSGSRSGRFGAAALAFSAGTFLCISLSDLLPELQFHAHDRFPLSAALLAGLGLMATASYWG